MEARVSEAKGTVAEASRHPWGNKVLYQWGVFDVAMLAPWEKNGLKKKKIDQTTTTNALSRRLSLSLSLVLYFVPLQDPDRGSLV